MDEALESSNLGDNSGANAQAHPTSKQDATAKPGGDASPSRIGGHDLSCPYEKKQEGADRRKRRRALISAPIRVRNVDVTQGAPDEISTTLDVSRNGVLFATSLPTFAAGMEVAVTFPYTKTPQSQQAEQSGRVVRVTQMPDGRRSVAIALDVGAGEDLVDAAGRTLVSKQPAASNSQQPAEPEKPLVLVVDANQYIRDSLKVHLSADGYEVIAVSSAAEAHEVLKMFTPALLISEIEGDDLPGYELCAHCKGTPRLRTMPVMLLTSSAYPSDYANAHSLGAVVCMAKPYRQERLAHIVRLLAPTPQAKARCAPARPADPSRRCGANKRAAAAASDSAPRRRWMF
ncbi:MAG TPA: response regulator [Candidatus Acidoferrum sp.]|nr:response regulator [Candidatus Acidoferrum sp.]